MAEAFNMRPFGLNVMPQTRHKDGSAQQSTEKTVGKAIEQLWEPVLNYLEKNENVFNGNVIQEIEKANYQTMRLGITMNEGQPLRNLDTQF